MKLKIILISICLILCSIIFVQISNTNKLKDKYQISISNEKAYMSFNSKLQNENRVLQVTNDVLKYSNDTILEKMNKYKESIESKNKKIEQLQYYNENFYKRDTTIIKIKGDSIFKNIDLDTTIYGKRNDTVFYSLYIKIKSPDTLITNPIFTNEKIVALSHVKETIDPPKKLFFLRWFQKKHWVIIADVKDTNPYIEKKEQRFIEIVK